MCVYGDVFVVVVVRPRGVRSYNRVFFSVKLSLTYKLLLLPKTEPGHETTIATSTSTSGLMSGPRLKLKFARAILKWM